MHYNEKDDFDDSALEFLTASILNGPRLFQSIAQRRITGIRSYLPTNISPEACRDFESGWEISRKLSKQWLSEYIYKYVIYNYDGGVIMSSITWRPNYPCVANSIAKKFYFDNQVYFLVTAHSKVDDILVAINEAEDIRSFVGICFPTWGIVPESVFDKSATEEVITDLVSGADIVFCSAWDNEGYLVGKVTKDSVCPSS